MSNFSTVLVAQRKARDLTLMQVTERAGMSQPHLSNLEAGRRAPSYEHALALADAFGLKGAKRNEFLINAGLAHIPPGLCDLVQDACRLDTSRP